jgi:putative DNA methylase
VLLALLLPDPCDPLCPEDFKNRLRELLPRVQGAVGPSDLDLRKALQKFIADFADWDLSANPSYLEVGRALVKAANGDDPPLVVDPFAGGGSIPLEALRLACDTFASDLNPVACLILKVILDDIPRHGPKLADEIRRVGGEVKQNAEKQLSDFYPRDSDGAVPIAYLWARTVRCESPNCGAEIPLVRSFWLCQKANRKRALKHHIARSLGHDPRVEFKIFEPKADKDVSSGSVSRAKATCVACGTVLPPERVRAQLDAQRGGANVVFNSEGQRTGGARMIAVVTLRRGEQGRQYRLPNDRDYEAVRRAQERLAEILREWQTKGKKDRCPIPDEPLPPIGTLGFRVQRYGILKWGDLFTERQSVALATWVPLLINQSAESPATSGPLALAFSRMAMCGMSLTNWNAFAEKMQHAFGRQALPIVWDFAEVVPLVHAPGAWQNAYDLVADVAEIWPGSSFGESQLADAAQHPMPDQSAGVWFTDPPYYDAVPYADLSDFFFVWLKRALPGHPLLRDPFDQGNPLTPKRQEAVQDETKHDNGRIKDRLWFEEAIARAFSEGRRILSPDGVGSVVFAHKTTEGWEAFLSGMIRGGWTITASWPIATEMGSRLRARESAALATSVHLICRPRPHDAEIGDWANALRELPNRVADWMERLQGEGVRGADLVFACIGPALEIFSRYSKVETAEGRDVTLGEYLEKVWEVVGRSALAQVLGTTEAKAHNGAAGAVEEDARLTALFLWTLQSTSVEAATETAGENEERINDEDEENESVSTLKGFTLVFDVVRRFAQPLGIELPKWEGRIIETKKGVVRLLPIAERAKQLFGDDGARAVAARLEREAMMPNALQGMLFPDVEESIPKARGRGRRRATAGRANLPDEALSGARQATTLDRVHAAMLLQAGGRTNALRALLKGEQERSPDFLRLANALSALYPKASEEKRLLDAMLLAVPRS